MSRRKLKHGGRPKALFGADGALMAGATLAAAAMNVAATASAAKQQAKAVTENAQQQAKAIDQQTKANEANVKENIAFTRQQNVENRQEQQNINATLQMIAGQNNYNDRLEASKMQLKYGGKPSNRRLKYQPSYGSSPTGFRVIDGGGVIPISVDNNGYGIYEIYGNDHEHYHTTPSGKRKTGVGIKFNNGEVVEGEGNQNSNQGELLYMTPDGGKFISKHNIDGYNPAKAVLAGEDPDTAFNIQESIKAANGYNDDGTRNSIKRKLPRRKAAFGNWAGDYTGAAYNSIGNIAAGTLGFIGNHIAGNRIARANNEAANILATAYGNLKTIDENIVDRTDYSAPKSMAVVRTADTNISPQLERIRRNAAYERREINNNTMSSAARLMRNAATNDREIQRSGEQYAYKHNSDEQIKQQNAERITNVDMANAEREAKAMENFARDRLSIRTYNNDIVNQRILGAAQAKSDAISNTAASKGQLFQASMSGMGNAISSSLEGFGSTAAGIRKENIDTRNVLIGADTANRIDYLISNIDDPINRREAEALYNSYEGINNDLAKTYRERLGIALNKNYPIGRIRTYSPSLGHFIN